VTLKDSWMTGLSTAFERTQLDGQCGPEDHDRQVQVRFLPGPTTAFLPLHESVLGYLHSARLPVQVELDPADSKTFIAALHSKIRDLDSFVRINVDKKYSDTVTVMTLGCISRPCSVPQAEARAAIGPTAAAPPEGKLWATTTASGQAVHHEGDIVHGKFAAVDAQLLRHCLIIRGTPAASWPAPMPLCFQRRGYLRDVSETQFHPSEDGRAGHARFLPDFHKELLIKIPCAHVCAVVVCCSLCVCFFVVAMCVPVLCSRVLCFFSACVWCSLCSLFVCCSLCVCFFCCCYVCSCALLSCFVFLLCLCLVLSLLSVCVLLLTGHFIMNEKEGK
jgi:hypothetical protein